MIPYTIYDNAGRILRSGTCQPETLDLQAGEGQSALDQSANDMTDYVLAGVITPRPTMELALSSGTVVADGTTEVTLTGAPAGAQVSIVGPVGSAGQADGSPITLTFVIPGDYEVSVNLFPYQESKVIIHAT